MASVQKRHSDLCVCFAELFSATIRKQPGAFFFPCLQCDKNGDVKKRRSGQAEARDALQQEAETCYQLRLPEDFYQFWKFCEELDPEKPAGRLCDSQCFLPFPSSNSWKGGRQGCGRHPCAALFWVQMRDNSVSINKTARAAHKDIGLLQAF